MSEAGPVAGPKAGTVVSIGGVDWYVVKSEWRMEWMSPRLTLATLDGFMRERSMNKSDRANWTRTSSHGTCTGGYETDEDGYVECDVCGMNWPGPDA